MNEGPPRYVLEREADRTRARLLGTIEALDRRRHQVLDWRLQLRRHAGQLIIGAGGIAGLVGMAVGIAIYRSGRRDKRRREERWRALARYWEHPERVAVRERRPLRAAMRVLLVTLTAAAVARLAARKLARSETEKRLPPSARPTVLRLG